VEKSLYCHFFYHFSYHFLTIFICFAVILTKSTMQGKKQQAAASSRVTPGGMGGADDSGRELVTAPTRTHLAHFHVDEHTNNK
jgi:hypothetical protein